MMNVCSLVAFSGVTFGIRAKQGCCSPVLDRMAILNPVWRAREQLAELTRVFSYPSSSPHSNPVVPIFVLF